MDKIRTAYIAAFDELNVLTAATYNLSQSLDEIIDDILSFLINAYQLGISAASEMLGEALETDVDNMRQAVYHQIEGMTFEDRVIDHVANNDYRSLQKLVETEFQRIYNTAILDGGLQVKSQNSLIQVNKTWITMMDNRVRDNHEYLEGQTIDIFAEFYTPDGDHACAPGGFKWAENNVGCRCSLYLSV